MDFSKMMGDRPVSICRELTKLHEETFRGTLNSAIAYFEYNKPRGEIVIIIGKDDPNVYFKAESVVNG